jgi:histidine triad (HIT) family protein
MNECLFCSISNGDPAKFIWHNDIAVAFHDIHPKAPIHVLVVPKKHFKTLDELDDAALAGALMLAAREVARDLGISRAYRLHINNGRAAGQVIDHLHIHLLGNLTPSGIESLRVEGL